MNHRYIASMAIAAVLTLGAGLLVRRQFGKAEAHAPLAVPPTETAALQELSTEGQARRMSAYFRDRVTAVAALVEYVPATATSGLRWGGGDTVITTLPESPVVALHVPRRDSPSRPPSLAPSDSMRGEWALIVARRRDGGMVSAVGLVGGRIGTTCNGRAVTQYIVDVPMHDGFAGSPLFDLAGRAAGMVARCGSRLVALPIREAIRLLAAPDSLGSRLRGRFGFVAHPLDEVTRRYFGADSGQLITEVVDATPAARAGWQPGDVILEVDGDRIGDTLTAGLLDSLASPGSHVVTIRRNGRVQSSRFSTSPTATENGVRLGLKLGDARVLPGVEIEEVRPTSAADSAGLRVGDRLVRVGALSVSSPAVARRLLGQIERSDSTTFLVVRRDSVTHGILLRR